MEFFAFERSELQHEPVGDVAWMPDVPACADSRDLQSSAAVGAAGPGDGSVTDEAQDGAWFGVWFGVWRLLGCGPVRVPGRG